VRRGGVVKVGRRKITTSITESDGHFMMPHMKNPIKIHDLRASYFCNRAIFHCIQIPRTTQINALASALLQLYLQSPVPIAGISPLLRDWTSRRPILSTLDAENRLLRRSLVPVIRIYSNEGGHAQQESFSCGENHNHRQRPAFEIG
jgi:hypothetical protein